LHDAVAQALAVISIADACCRLTGWRGHGAAARLARGAITTGFARSYIMMPYQSYQFYQAERPKTAVEIRRADEQLGHMAENVSRLWQHATRPVARLRDLLG
jgi:hypothetical protein